MELSLGTQKKEQLHCLQKKFTIQFSNESHFRVLQENDRGSVPDEDIWQLFHDLKK